MKGIPALARERGFSGELVSGEPLSRHCALGLGGEADLYAIPLREADLLILLRVLDEKATRWMMLGGGTNVLFPDTGFRGCVIRLGEGFRRWERVDHELVEVGAAFPTPGLPTSGVEEGLTGLEFLAGIPGTLGGALRMNAGTREREMAAVVTEVEMVNRAGARWRKREDLAFSYRNLILPGDTVVASARLRLQRDDPHSVRARVETLLAKRREAQPREPSVGCWFKNPPGDSAGRLIDAAGLKGARVGGAEVSSVHANFLVRRGHATADDFRTLAERVRNEVALRFGVLLAEEVHVVSG